MSTNLIPQNTTASAGPLIRGVLFNWGLYGVLSVQVYLYYLAFPRDRPFIKCLVFGLYCVETVQTILIMHDAFRIFGMDYGNPAALDNALLAGLSLPILSGIVSCTVQIFFAHRIFILSKSKILPSIICVIALTQGSSGIAQGVQALQLGIWSKIQTDAFVSCTIWLTGAAVCDIVIAISMIYCLSGARGEFKSTQVLISKLIRLTIETGCLTAAVATTDIALFLAFSQHPYHTIPAQILAKLYSNTLLVTFNRRLVIVDGRVAAPKIELSSSTWTAGERSRKMHWRQKNQSQGGTARPIEVTVDVQHDLNWGRSGSLNESDTCANQPEGMKVAALADDPANRKTKLVDMA